MKSANPLDSLAHLPIDQQAQQLLTILLPSRLAEPDQIIVLQLALRVARADHAQPTLQDLQHASDQLVNRLQQLVTQLRLIHNLNASSGQRRALIPGLSPGAWADPDQNPLHAFATDPNPNHLTTFLQAAGLAHLSDTADLSSDLHVLAQMLVRVAAPPHQTTLH